MQLRRTVAACLVLLAGLAASGSRVLSAERMFRFSETHGESPSSDFEGMIVDSIEIDNRNIYDTKLPGYGGFLFRTANRLHLVTRQRVVGRELLLQEGQAFSRDLAEETARNLRQRLPLNDAWVEVERLDDRRVLVRVVTIDQWSLQGGVRSFDRSGQETSLQVGVEDKNLLGQAQYLSLDYYVQESDNNYVTSTFREIRVLGRPLSLQLDFSSNPTARLKKLTFGRPFYNLAQTLSFQIETSDGGGRQERFYEGDRIAHWQAKYDATRLSADYRFGPYHRKTTVGASYLYVSNRASDRVIDYPALFSPGNFPDDSVYHRIGVGAAQSFIHYVVVNRINGFAYTEDMSVGTEFKASFGRAFVPGFRSYLHDLLKVSGLGTMRFGSLLVSGEYKRSLWFRQSVDLRRETQCGLWAYYNRFRFMTLALRTWYASDRGEDPNPLDLGGKNGLRGYATEFTSGDRLHVTNIEARIYTGVEILSLLLGGVVFTDIGRTWASGQPVVLRDYYQSFGAGLRVSLEKLSRTELIRADVAITPDGRWELLLGTGQYF